MKLTEDDLQIHAPEGPIRSRVIRPLGDEPRPGLLCYTDIFQLTESTLRTARRLAAYGFTVVVPEVYPHTDLAGRALEFDDAGKQDGLRGAAITTTAQFDADRAAVIDAMAADPQIEAINVLGFCLGGHLAFRAAFDPRVAATVCVYATGLQNGALGADDPSSLAQADQIRGRLMMIFGTADPHVPAPARLKIVSALYAAGLEHLELHVYAGGEHAFMRDVGPRHDPLLTDLGLTAAVSFLSGRS